MGFAARRQLDNLVKWAKLIPHFRDLPVNDQMLLLKNGWNELIIASFSHRSINCTDGILLSEGVKVMVCPPGVKLMVRPAGVKLMVRPPGVILKVLPPGDKLVVRPPGVKLMVRPPGVKLMVRPPGVKLTVRPPGVKLMVCPQAGRAAGQSCLTKAGDEIYNRF